MHNIELTGLISFENALDMAVEDISSRVQEMTEVVIARFDSPSDDLSDFISDELASYLIKKGKFIVLERGSALESVNEEHIFQMSGLVSDESAVGIGHHLGAKVVFTGIFTQFTGFNQLRLRAIDVRSSQILCLYTARIRSDDLVLTAIIDTIKNTTVQTIAEDFLVYLNRGEDFLREGRYDEAILELNKALTINGSIADAYFFRGIAYNSKGDVERAISDFTEAIRYNSNYATAYLYRGDLYFSKLDYASALEDFHAAFDIEPNRSTGMAINRASRALELQQDDSNNFLPFATR